MIVFEYIRKHTQAERGRAIIPALDARPRPPHPRPTIVARIDDKPRPFSGTVSLGEGGMAKDLARYYLTSEQTRTAFAAGVQFDREGRAIGAAGLCFQALPGAEDAFLSEVEGRMERLPPLGLWFSEGGTRDTFLSEAVSGLGVERLGEKSVSFNCGCSRGQPVRRARRRCSRAR